MIPRGVSAAAALLRHESRRCGPAVWAVPVAGIVAGAAVSVLPPAARPVLLLVSCTALACLTALCAVAILGRERMLELHLSMPVPVPVLLARRLSVMAVSAGVAGAAAGGTALASGTGAEGALGTAAGGVAGGVAGAAAGAGSVLCTAALLTGTALWTWARWHSVAAASGTLIAVWLGYVFFWAVNVPPEVDRTVCAAVGTLLIWRGLRALADPGRVLAKEAR